MSGKEMKFYPDRSPVPPGLRTEEFLLRTLRASDVELDYEAVMASREMLHLRSGGRWPRENFTLEENLADLQQHEAEFHARTSFTYTVMDPTQTRCLGCVYIYPLHHILERAGVPETQRPSVGDYEAETSFWVRRDRIADDLDRHLLAALLPWLEGDFAFSRVYLRAHTTEPRHIEIFRDAGLRLVVSMPAADRQLMLFE